MQRIVTAAMIPILLVLFLQAPASASFFLCEKTDPQTGNLVSPDSPQYDKLEYDNEIVYIFQSISDIALLGVFVFGILGSIYATVRDATFTGEGDQDAAKYVKMRSRLIIAGVVIPILLIILSFIVEAVTQYETTCFLSLPF